MDLTAVPIVSGFWTTWLPQALPQVWPFCWHVAAVIDHHSRRVMGLAVWKKPPTSRQIQQFLNRAIRNAKTAPNHIICDKGCQFWCEGFKKWCKRNGVRPRFGAVGQHGSIAVVERFIRTMKTEGLRRILLPLRLHAMRRELFSFADWYNEHRPHTTLNGKTPDEVYWRKFPANRKPRWEPRQRWPRGSPCALPWALVKGKPGATLELNVPYHEGKKHLPIVELMHIPKRVA